MVTGWSVKMRQNGGLDCYYTSAHLVCVKGIIYKGILLMSSLDHISGMGRNWRTGLINFSKDSWTWFVCICVLRALGSLGIKHLGGFLLSRTEYYSGTGLHKYFLFLNFFFLVCLWGICCFDARVEWKKKRWEKYTLFSEQLIDLTISNGALECSSKHFSRLGFGLCLNYFSCNCDE